MLEFRRITSAESPYWRHFVELYESAFPLYERRTAEMQLSIVTGEPERFHSFAIVEDDTMVGLFSYWDFGNFAYGEHFAVDEQLRGRRIGERAMTQFVETVGKPVVIEVELPETEIARRRIGFYERIGYVLSNKPYMQPSYGVGQQPLPLALMEYGGNVLETDFDFVVRTIHREAYQVKE